MNNFISVSEDELLNIDGGSWKAVAIGGVITVAGVVGAVASCGTAVPTYGMIATGLSIIGGCATTTYGIFSEIKK